jgi:hypothetical protein
MATVPGVPSTIDPAIGAVVQDGFDAAALGKAVVDAIKAQGVQGAVALAPRIVTAVEKDVADVTAALPTIKAGYKTSEFWVVVGALVLVGVVPYITGKPAPFDATTVIGALAAVYSVVRGFTKSSATK